MKDMKSQNEENKTEEPETKEVNSKPVKQEQPSFNFQTVPMEQPSETVEDKLNRLLHNTEELLERTLSYDDNHAMYEDMVNFYNSFDAKAKSLTDKLDREVEYTRYIETQISSKSIEKECLMLKKALVEERALMGVKFDGIKSDLDEKMRQSENLTKSELEKFSNNIEEIAKRVGELTSIDDKITSAIETFRKDMTKASDNEFKILTTKCTESVNSSTEKVESIKKNVLSFLKSCEKQNGELIKKIPEQKRRFNWKDALIYVMSGLCIICLIVQVCL